MRTKTRNESVPLNAGKQVCAVKTYVIFLSIKRQSRIGRSYLFGFDGRRKACSVGSLQDRMSAISQHTENFVERGTVIVYMLEYMICDDKVEVCRFEWHPGNINLDDVRVGWKQVRLHVFVGCILQNQLFNSLFWRKMQNS